MSLYELVDLTGNALSGFTTNPLMIFLMINIILFVLGTFMDMASTILICTPIFLPIATEMGMGPVQFGMVMLINCALGLNTPPVGTTQFVGCAHRRHYGRPGHADDPAVLCGIDHRPAVRNLYTRLLDLAAQLCVGSSSSVNMAR